MCTRALWNTNSLGVYCGRNMDWFEDIRSNMWVLPRGIERDGAVAEHPFTWTSRYGSLAITAYDIASADGLNEAGLAAHLLYLPETSTAPRDPAQPGLSLSLWLQWYLDMCGSVAEAVEMTRANPFQLQMTGDPVSGKLATVHIALDDASGDTAIFECIDGRITIYHDRRYVVMTNQPTFDKQIENLQRYRGFGGDEPLPGTHQPADRFVRGAYYVSHLPEPDSERMAVAALMSVMRNTAAPFGISDPERPNISTTVWRTITNLTDGVIYFDSVVSPSVSWVKAGEIDFTEGSPVRKLQLVDRYDLAGDVTGQFTPADAFRFVPAS